MKKAIALVAVSLVLIVAVIFAAAQANEPAPQNDTPAQPAPQTPQAQAPQPPIDPEAVRATVGRHQIRAGDIERIIEPYKAQVPPPMWDQLRQMALRQVITQRLLVAYANAAEVSLPQEKYQEVRAQLEAEAAAREMTPDEVLREVGVTDEMIREHIRIETLFEDRTQPEKLMAYAQAHPERFDGTQVAASHILIAVEGFEPDPSDRSRDSRLAPTAAQRRAVERARRIAADIAAGEVSFEEAARQFSTCPSKERGGGLGEFAYYGQMDTGFSRGAFALEVGQVSPPVQTRFGVHVIKVTARTPGERPFLQTVQIPQPEGSEEAPEERTILTPQAQQAAEMLIVEELLDAAFAQAHTTAPIVVVED